jgi:putative two-component system response regulator
VKADAPTPVTTILVVDDGAPNVKLLEMFLGAEGYATISASSGREALVLAASAQPDLVLLDAMMPGLDGFETLARLKADARTRSIPVMMVTALDDLTSRRRAIESGAEAFLGKPIVRADLRERVRDLLAAVKRAAPTSPRR